MSTLRESTGSFLVAVALASPASAAQRAGDLDVTFGVGGRLVRPGFQVIEDVVVQPDGKILVVGNRYDESVTFNIRIARYNADGTADDSFGNGGVVETDFGGLHDEAKAVALQADGKIVVAGMHGYEVWCCEYYYDLILVRYEADGSLDASFGDGGKVIADFGREVDIGNDVAIQSDGKIVVAGATGSAGFGHADFAVARYNADGSPDAGFGLDGRTTTDFPDPYYHDEAMSVMIQPDGHILLGGTTTRSFWGTDFYDYGLVRYLSDGTLDPSFGQAGLVITDVGTMVDVASAVDLQPDGRIVLAGVADPGTGFLTVVVRYLKDGTLDASFGAGGVVRTNVGEYEAVGDVAIQPDGRILVAGAVGPTYPLHFTLLRYMPDGRPDGSFGRGGRVLTDFPTRNPVAWAKSLAVQADGKIVVAGDHSGYTEASTNGLIARYHGYADVRPDIKVNGADGGVVVSPGDAIEATIALDPGPRVGEDAVWWVLADTPSGLRTYDFATGSWLSGASPGYRGPLVPVSGLTVFAGLAPSSGPVRLYFAVQVRGGAGGPELPYSDELGVTVTP